MEGKLTRFLCCWIFAFLSQASFAFSPSAASTASEAAESLSSNRTDFSILNDTLIQLADTVYYQISDCSSTAEVCVDIPLAEINNYQIFQDGASYASGISACGIDTVKFYDYSNLNGQGSSGPYVLQSWIVNGVIRMATFDSIPQLIDSMNVWDPTGNWADSTALNQIHGGDEANTYSESMVIWVPAINMPNIIDRDERYDINGTSIVLPEGIHQIVINETATACSDTFVAQIQCIVPQTFNFELLIGESSQTCLDFTTLTSSIDTVYNFCPVQMDPAVSFNLINGDSCLRFAGLEVGIDTACIRFCDDNQLCDTSTIIVRVRSPLGLTEQDVVLSAQNRDTICLDTTVFIGSVDTIYNACPSSSGTFASFELDTVNYCVYVEGLAFRGIDTACIVICDFPDCDTLQLNVEVFRQGPAFIYDTILVNQNGQACDFDTTNLVASLLLIDNFCAGTSGEFINFNVDNTSLCVDYDAIDIGTDTACLLLRDLFGNADTTFLIVTAELPESSIIVDTIRQGLVVNYCADTTELGGMLEDTIYTCQAFGGNATSIVIDTASYCVEVTGLQPGTDTICLVVCDEFMVCDTTTIQITVDTTGATTNLPIAVADLDSTSRNTPVTINAIANDAIPNNLWTQFFVIPVANGGIGPNNGTTVGNAANGTIEYIPDQGFCGDFDLFSYSVCNDNGCDTATVMVFVNCPSDSLRVLNGISPNGDNRNDSFTIEGIENYPDHTLYIYNRWGNLVLEQQNYRNDWQGTWDGTDLPDGVYFYLLDTGEGESLSGYLMLHR